MKKAEFEQKIFDICKPLVTKNIIQYGKTDNDIFPQGEFTPYAANYGYLTIFIHNWNGWSDRMVFEVHYNQSRTKIEIMDNHYFKA